MVGAGVSAWIESWRADPVARRLADRHYNRQKVGAPQFVPPGRCLVLVTPNADAFWVTSWPFAEFTKHRWGGAWVCSAFRREPSAARASDLIRDAVAATRWHFGGVPFPHGMVTFVDAEKVKHKRDPGRCYLRAGFVAAGETEGGLLAFVLRPEDMPAAAPPMQRQVGLFASGAA